MINTSITFDELQLRAYVSRKQGAAMVRGLEGQPLGFLLRVGGRCKRLQWQPNPNLCNPPLCPLEVFAIVATMI